VPEQEPLFVSRLPINWPQMTAVEAREWLPQLEDPKRWDQSDELLPTIKGWLQDTIKAKEKFDAMVAAKAAKADKGEPRT